MFVDAGVSSASVYMTSVLLALTVAASEVTLVPVEASVFVSSTTSVQFLVVPALTTWPLDVLPKFSETAHVPPAQVAAEDEATTVPMELLFSSRTFTPLRKLEDDGPLPVKVMTNVFNDTAPALFAENVSVAKLSVVCLDRLLATPRAAALNESLLRNTVCGLPFGDESDIDEVELDVLPNAVTAAPFAILKVCAALSVAADEL